VVAGYWFSVCQASADGAAAASSVDGFVVRRGDEVFATGFSGAAFAALAAGADFAAAAATSSAAMTLIRFFVFVACSNLTRPVMVANTV
jgi:hypothetical protein